MDSAKKWWSGGDSGDEKNTNKGWNISEKLESAASTVTSYSSSAASSIGSTAKSAWNSEAVAATSSAVKSATKSTASYIGSTAKDAWNSEAVASGKSTVSSASASAWSLWSQNEPKKIESRKMDSKNDGKSEKSDSWGATIGSVATTVTSYSSSAASSIGSTVKSAWNSEAVASGKSAVSSGVGSATSGFWSWWSGDSKEENDKSGDSIRGGLAAMSKNARQYVIQTSGRSSNILNIFDKTNKSSLGNPRWWIRFDRPHGSVDYHHINMNPKLTGVPDPHIKISPTTAKTVGYLGRIAEKANDYAPMLVTAAMIYEAVKIGGQAKKDYDLGTTRNTVHTVATTTGTWTSGSLGAYAGGLLGSTLFPGIGTIFGGLVGGALAGYYGGHYSHVASEMALNRIQWDMATLECHGCQEMYTWKKYQEIQGICCTPFSGKKLDYWKTKLVDGHQNF